MNYKLIAWGLGFLIIIVLVVFYFAYSKYALQKAGRNAINGLTRVIKRTRLILIILIIALAGDLGYGHFSNQNSTIHLNLISRTGRLFSSVKNKFFDKSAESSSSSESAKKARESSKLASSKKKAKEMTGAKAVAIVKNYYAKQKTESDVEQYKFIKSKISTVSQKKVYEVGAYKTENGKLVQVHDFEVNAKGKFDLLY
ncbi:hypothetical protein [Pediococcus ethanolidurans]|uniref:Uncharacterized protein n=1 Tax=Pediococcus ethanolidurans TaxID=319653 RepID=A0A0R2K194_9LACO|nr:hypothetical protein [Pediococcus ethanolidurans]KRN83376.1 hypothetical protein IV87_GL000805 [Pediococcus ethanolidurans]GEN95835.1 hypothetical protein PET01_18850 [Pediococcus ethanolidurans]SER22315.1 hypothetical protein SAMN04487973_10327 [Pediococcus ethanolidurans]